MSWPELIHSFYEERNAVSSTKTRMEFHTCAAREQIELAEEKLNARLPLAWKELMHESDGVTELVLIDSGEWIECMWLVWPISQVVWENLYYRSEYQLADDRDFSTVVFFADAGADGILFGFPVGADGTCAGSVVVWDPLEDTLPEVAPSLQTFLHGWLTGSITV